MKLLRATWSLEKAQDLRALWQIPMTAEEKMKRSEKIIEMLNNILDRSPQQIGLFNESAY